MSGARARASGERHSVAQSVRGSGPLQAIVLGAGVAVLVGALYAHTLTGPFVFDDLSNIQDNAAIRLTTLSVAGLVQAAFHSNAWNRPVANISFALNYYVHQDRVGGYHVVNILIHLITGLLLFLFVRTTLTLPVLRARYAAPGWIAGGAALLWLVHPVHTQSVTYVVQRMNSMAAMLYIASLVLYVRARLTPHRRRQWALWAGCGVTGLLALGTKEIAATLPVVVGLYEWYFFQGLRRDWLRSWRVYGAGGLVGWGLLLAWVYLRGERLDVSAAYPEHDFTQWERVMTEWRVVLLYLRLLFFPHPSQLNLDHDFVLSRSLLDPPTTGLALVALLGLVGLAWVLAPKERLLSFCLVWFLLHLVLESSIIKLELVFEHRTYVPSMLLSVLVVTLVYRAVRPAWLGGAVLGLVVLVFSVWTYERNGAWATAETLWRDCVAKAPHKARPHHNLGVALAQQGKLPEALAHYREALRLRPTYVEAHTNLGIALAQQGKTVEALAHYTEALRLQPTYVEAHNNLGVLLTQQGKTAEALVHYTEALRRQPTSAKAHNNLGLLLAQQGKTAEALAHYREALRLRPTSAEVHHNLGDALAKQGQLAEALAHYTEALRLRPTFAEVHHNLGLLFAKQGQRAKAVAAMEAALRYRPDWPQAAHNLAWLLATQEHPSTHEAAEAVRLAEGACQATGYRDAGMLNTLAIAYAAGGRMTDAAQTLRQALARAQATGQETLARQIQERLAGYESAGKP